MITRRGFLQSILIAGTAPAIVRAESLMRLPAKRIIVPELVLDYGDTLMIEVDAAGRIVRIYHPVPPGLWVHRVGTGMYSFAFDSPQRIEQPIIVFGPNI